MTATHEWRPVRQPIIGTEDGLKNALETAHRQGRLVSVTRPRPYGQGRYAVSAVLLEPVRIEPAQRPARRRTPAPRHIGTAVAVTGVLAALAALGVVLALALAWVAAHFAIIAGTVLVLGALVLMLRSKTGACMGLHCPGCGHQ